MILLGLHWALLGARDRAGALTYVAMTVLFSTATSRRPRASPMPGTPASAARWRTR